MRIKARAIIKTRPTLIVINNQDLFASLVSQNKRIYILCKRLAYISNVWVVIVFKLIESFNMSTANKKYN